MKNTMDSPSREETVALIDTTFFKGNLDIFTELYDRVSVRLRADGYNGCFDAPVFSPKWWSLIYEFFIAGSTYEAISYIQNPEIAPSGFFTRTTKREIERIKNRQELCEKGKEVFVEMISDFLLQKHSGILEHGTLVTNYIPPKLRSNPVVPKIIIEHGISSIEVFRRTYNLAVDGTDEDKNGYAISKEAMTILALVKRVSMNISPEDDDMVESSKSKVLIEKLRSRVELIEERERGVIADYNKLIDQHKSLIDEFAALEEDREKLVQENTSAKKGLETITQELTKQNIEVVALQQKVRTQSLLLTYQSEKDLQILFGVSDPVFQKEFRAILKRFIGNIKSSIGPYLSSTTSSNGTGSGTFAYHVINPILSKIVEKLDNPEWSGSIRIQDFIITPQNGDLSKGLMFDFGKHVQGLDEFVFTEFFVWLGNQRVIGGTNLSQVFSVLQSEITKKIPVLHRETQEYITRFIKGI